MCQNDCQGKENLKVKKKALGNLPHFDLVGKKKTNGSIYSNFKKSHSKEVYQS